MKTKNILFLFLLNTLLFTQLAHAQKDSAKLMLTRFYNVYITAIGSDNGEDKIQKIQQQYSTAKLTAWLKKQEELDDDPYINAQDVDMDWLKTMQITKDAKIPNLYIVSFFDNYNKTRRYVKLFVAKEGNKYKISGFKN